MSNRSMTIVLERCKSEVKAEISRILQKCPIAGPGRAGSVCLGLTVILFLLIPTISQVLTNIFRGALCFYDAEMK